MKKIVVIGGSNSKSSINKQLALYAAAGINNAELDILDLNDFDLPLYGIDLENEAGIPEAAITFLNHIKQSDGVVISLAEHNGAYSTAFKNVFDWMSRIDGKLWSDKPMLLMAASPGGRGGRSVLDIAGDRFPRMGAQITSEFSLPFFQKNFIDGEIIDDDLNSQLESAIKKFESKLM
ncbi:MAG: NAD(P)H-dependent oxidoreductase [Flavobacteriaceae bacterium]|nr:NAD(P)H-dependent oxidoreductase [Flavobacteriaceae bacterium]